MTAYLLTSAAAAVLALLYTTLVPGVSLLLAVIGLAIFVDITIAVFFALVAGLLLDVLDVRVLGFSSALSYVLAAGIVDVLRAHVRIFGKHPAQLFLLAVALAALLRPLYNGIEYTASGLLDVLGRIVTHIAIALLFLPLFLYIGERYQDRLRERGML